MPRGLGGSSPMSGYSLKKLGYLDTSLKYILDRWRVLRYMDLYERSMTPGHLLIERVASDDVVFWSLMYYGILKRTYINCKLL